MIPNMTTSDMISLFALLTAAVTAFFGVRQTKANLTHLAMAREDHAMERLQTWHEAQVAAIESTVETLRIDLDRALRHVQECEQELSKLRQALPLGTDTIPGLIFLVEDDDEIAEVITQHVQRAYPPPVVQLLRAACMSELRALCGYLTPAIVLLDLRLPDSPEAETLERARSLLPHTFIILLSGYYGNDEGRQAIQTGADDYVLKGPNVIPDLVTLVGKVLARQRRG